MQLNLIQQEDRREITQIALLESEIFSDAWSEKEIENTVKQKQSLCAVASENGEVVGYFLCYYVLDECEIARIAVSSKLRRTGIGDALFTYLLQLCREKKIERILLEVRAGNEPAIAFYKKNGFETDGVRKGYYAGEKPEDAVLMSRDV